MNCREEAQGTFLYKEMSPGPLHITTELLNKSVLKYKSAKLVLCYWKLFAALKL